MFYEHTNLPLAYDLKAIPFWIGTIVKVYKGPITPLLAIRDEETALSEKTYWPLFCDWMATLLFPNSIKVNFYLGPSSSRLAKSGANAPDSVVTNFPFETEIIAMS